MTKEFSIGNGSLRKMLDSVDGDTRLHLVCLTELELLKLRANIHVQPAPQFDEVFLARRLRLINMLGHRVEVENEQAK